MQGILIQGIVKPRLMIIHTILIVEDNDDDLFFLKRCLKKISQLSDTQFIYAKNLQETIDALQKKPDIQLVILDLNLPKSTGSETLASVTDYTQSPIIILTSDGDEEFALKTLHDGAHDFLLKDELRHDTIARSIFRTLERDSLHKRLANTENRLRHSEALESLGRLTTEFSHEVQNPLAIISLCLDLFELNKKDIPENLHPPIARAKRALTRASGLMKRILKGSHPNVLKQEDAINLGETIKDIIRLDIDGSIQQKVIYHQPKSTSTLRIDVDDLRQILINFVSNAASVSDDDQDIIIKIISPVKGDSIENGIFSNRIDPSTTYTGVSITDHGPGFPDNTDQTIFQAFTTSKRAGHGLGLGLWICNTIALNLGGVIRVKKGFEDTGAEVCLFIPRDQA